MPGPGLAARRSRGHTEHLPRIGVQAHASNSVGGAGRPFLPGTRARLGTGARAKGSNSRVHGTGRGGGVVVGRRPGFGDRARHRVCHEPEATGLAPGPALGPTLPPLRRQFVRFNVNGSTLYQSSRALRSEHNEAVRLAWKSIHVPFGTILLGAFLLACVLSAVMQVIALGPSNAMP